ncbi:MAG: N-6 DNA methylase, partial [Dermatophilaceae bacterium]
ASELFKAYAGFADIDGRAHVATLEEIEGNDFNLNIPLYVAPAGTGEQLTLADALTNLEAAHTRAQETRSALEVELAKWGLSA